MKPIIINGDILCGTQISGIPRYAFEVVRSVDEIMQTSEQSAKVILCYPSHKALNVNNLLEIQTVPLECHGKRFGSSVLRKYVNQYDGICCHLGNGISYNRNGITCIHDIRAVETRDYDNKSKRIEFELMKWSAKLQNTTIVTVSEYQKKAIHSYFGIPDDRIHVIPNGWEHLKRIDYDDTIFDRHPEIEKGSYYYSLGSVAKHKNYKWIHEVAKRNPNKMFLVAGNISRNVWGIDEAELKLENVVFLGYVSDEENKSLMKNCKAFLHPSKYEGFGIPPLEALSLGKKIIVANATCLPEIFGKSAVYFDPDDYDVDIERLENIEVNNSEEILRKYTWENAARKWIDLFEKMGGGIA